MPFGQATNYFSFLTLQRDSNYKFYIKKYNVLMDADPTQSRFKLEAKVEVPAFNGASANRKDFGFDFNDEYIAVSNHQLQDGRGAVIIYSYDDLKYQRLIMGSAGYLGVGQRVRLAKGTLPDNVKANYIYFNSHVEKADAWSSFYIG